MGQHGVPRPPKFATQGILGSVKEARPLSSDAPARLLDADGAGAFGLLLFAAAQDLPEAQRLVGSGGGDRGAVGALRHVQHAARVPAQLGDAHLLRVRDRLRRVRVGASAATRTIEGYFRRLRSG